MQCPALSDVFLENRVPVLLLFEVVKACSSVPMAANDSARGLVQYEEISCRLRNVPKSTPACHALLDGKVFNDLAENEKHFETILQRLLAQPLPCRITEEGHLMPSGTQTAFDPRHFGCIRQGMSHLVDEHSHIRHLPYCC